MKWCKFYVASVLVVGILGNIAHSAILDIKCRFGGSYLSPSTVYLWGFDYDLQQLTVVETILGLEDSSYYHVELEGTTDSEDSVFHVTTIITNDTGVAWTGLILNYSPHGWLNISDDWIEVAGLTKLQTPVLQDRYCFEFSEPDPVLHGETFTMQFDVHVHPRDPAGVGMYFYDVWRYELVPVPEPSTILLITMGGLALLRNIGHTKLHRKRWNRNAR